HLGPAAGRFGQSSSLAGKLNSGLRSEAEGAYVAVKALVSQAQRDLDSADVTGILQHLSHRQRAVRLVIMNETPVDGDGSHLAIHHFVGIGEPLFQRRSQRDDLETRAGLVNVADGAVFE